MGLSSTQWDAIEPVEKNVFYSRQLWIEPNFRVCFIPGGCQGRILSRHKNFLVNGSQPDELPGQELTT